MPTEFMPERTMFYWSKMYISQVKPEDTITLSEKAMKFPKVAQLVGEAELAPPSWLKRKGGAGKIARNPVREDVTEPIEDQDIIEFYSR